MRRLLLPLLAALLAAGALACAPEQVPPQQGTAGQPGGGQGGSGGEGSGGTGGELLSPVPLVAPVALSVQPGSGRGFLTGALGGAARSIRAVSYLLTDDAIENALIAAAARGVEVRVMVEGSQRSNDSARDRLSAAGVQVREGDPAYALTHEKALVVDDALAFVLTQNLTTAGFETNREYDLTFSGPEVAELAAIFDADWGRTGYTAESSLVVSPINSRQRLEALFSSAQDEILVAMEVFNDAHARDLLVARARGGVRVRVILEDPADIDDHRETAALLTAAGAEVRWLATPELHAKAIVMDRRLAYVGSVNLTYSSLDRNREVGVVTDDAAAVARIVRTIEDDLAVGRAEF